MGNTFEPVSRRVPKTDLIPLRVVEYHHNDVAAAL